LFVYVRISQCVCMYFFLYVYVCKSVCMYACTFLSVRLKKGKSTQSMLHGKLISAGVGACTENVFSHHVCSSPRQYLSRVGDMADDVVFAFDRRVTTQSH